MTKEEIDQRLLDLHAGYVHGVLGLHELIEQAVQLLPDEANPGLMAMSKVLCDALSEEIDRKIIEAFTRQ